MAMRLFLAVLLTGLLGLAPLGSAILAQEDDAPAGATTGPDVRSVDDNPSVTEVPLEEASPATEPDPPASRDAGVPKAVAAEPPHDDADDAEHGAGEHGAGADHGEAGHAGGHAHDPHDLSHANQGAELASPMELRFELTIATMIVFLLLLLILGKFAWGPIAKALDDREMNIANMISTAEKNAKESEFRLRELEARLAAQAEEARVVLGAARREGELVKERMLTEAQEAARQEKERALDEIRTAKNLALREIAQKSVNTAVDLASNIIRREVRPEDHSALISDSLSKFQSNN
jgi:F-type H+-transporting ATPase subunit b